MKKYTREVNLILDLLLMDRKIVNKTCVTYMPYIGQCDKSVAENLIKLYKERR